MKRAKPPKNTAKQILKLFKHFYDPKEEWWTVPDTTDNTTIFERWKSGCASFCAVSLTPRETWNEEEIFLAVKKTNTPPFSSFKKQKLQDYRELYLPRVERAIEEALLDSEAFRSG